MKMNLICGLTRTEMEEIAIILKEEHALFEAAILAIHGRDSFKIKEELDSLRGRILDRISRVRRFGNSDVRQMQLQFRSGIRSEILTSQEIKGEGGASMQLALVDASIGNLVVDGPYASASIEIVPLEGKLEALEGDDLTTEVFEKSIVQDMDGKKPLVLENGQLKLRRGVVDMQNIKFRHDTKPAVFRLGARMADSTHRNRVKEAVTNCFTLKDYRCKYHMNHEVPCLKDAVSRLVHIGKCRAKRLHDKKIITVEDFLIRIMTDPDGLREILKFGPNEWKETVDNARACSDKKVYCYADFQQKKGIVFDFSEEVLGLHMNNQYAPKNTFSEIHKAEAQELKASACKNWSAVKSCENENSGQEYLNEHLGGCWSPGDLPMADYPPCSRSSTGNSNKAQESCSKLDIAPECMNSVANLAAETSQVGINIDDFEISIPHFSCAVAQTSAAAAAAMEFSYGSNLALPKITSAPNQAREENLDPLIHHTMLSLLDPEVPCFSDYDCFLQDGYGKCEVTTHTTVASASFVGSKAVHGRHLRMRWIRLLCLSRWLSVGKKVSTAMHKIKKQRVH